MQFRKTRVELGTNNLQTIELPLLCPYCGLAVHLRKSNHTNLNTNDGSTVYLVNFLVPCCNKNVVASILKKSSSYTYLWSYPTPINDQLPESIQEISPRFVNLYNSAQFALVNEHLELAGSGFRNALEILVKDYAITELNENPDEVARKRLAAAIKAYLPDEKLRKTADVVRILGNDFTHYQRIYDEHGVDVLVRYLKFFITKIDVEYQINHPPVHS